MSVITSDEITGKEKQRRFEEEEEEEEEKKEGLCESDIDSDEEASILRCKKRTLNDDIEDYCDSSVPLAKRALAFMRIERSTSPLVPKDYLNDTVVRLINSVTSHLTDFSEAKHPIVEAFKNGEDWAWLLLSARKIQNTIEGSRQLELIIRLGQCEFKTFTTYENEDAILQICESIHKKLFRFLFGNNGFFLKYNEDFKRKKEKKKKEDVDVVYAKCITFQWETTHLDDNVVYKEQTTEYIRQLLRDPEAYLKRLYHIKEQHSGPRPPLSMVYAIFYGGDFPEIDNKEIREDFKNMCRPLPQFWIYDGKNGECLCAYYQKCDIEEEMKSYTEDGKEPVLEHQPRHLGDLIQFFRDNMDF